MSTKNVYKDKDSDDDEMEISQIKPESEMSNHDKEKAALARADVIPDSECSPASFIF